MDHTNTNQTETGAVAAIVKSANTPSLNVEPKGLAVYPNGTVIHLEKEEYGTHPKRKRAVLRLYETASFINYVRAHKSETATHIFGQASEEGGEFTANIDFHERGPDGQAHWGEHIVKLVLSTTPEWRRWLSLNSKLVTQESFAEFLEENLNDIVRPDAGQLIDLAQMLTGKKSVTFKSGKNLQNGAIALEYTETIETSGGRINGDMQVPSEFYIGLCPFVGAAGVEIRARLRFRITDGGKLHFAYILDRPFKVIETAFNLARSEIEDQLALPVHLGSAAINVPNARPTPHSA